jgi:hypothetical protein
MTNPQTPTTKSPKWHYIYFGLAFFNVLTLFISLYLNHIIANQMESDVRSYQRHGLSAYIPKLFKPHDLAEKLDKYLLS